MLVNDKYGIDTSKKKRCAIYCRVSTEEQATMGYSLDEQERLLSEACISLGYEVVDIYCDRGISGKNITGRPEMKRMLKEARENKFDVVLCWKVNRLARNLLDLLEMVNLLEKYNVGIKSYSEPFETETPQGKLLFHMMAAVGEFERGTISQNVKMGLLARAREGKWNGGAVLGYDIVKTEGEIKQKGRGSKLVVNPKEAEAVKLIFKMYAQGNGYKAIVSHINTLGYKTKKGNLFSVGAIKEILLNPVYIGMIRYNVRQEWNEKRRRKINPNPILVEGEHEAIIDNETWEKVQFNLKQSQGKPTRIYDGEFPLTGILKCPVCGAGMVISRASKKRKDGSVHRINYYACGAWKNKGTQACNSNAIRTDKVHEYVYGRLSEFISNENLIKQVVNNINKETKQKVVPSQQELNRLVKKMEQVQHKKVKVQEMYEDDLINKEEFLNRINLLREDEEKLKLAMYSCKEVIQDGVNEPISYQVVQQVLSDFEKLIKVCDTQEQRKRLLHMLIDKITINANRDIESIELKLTDNLIKFINESTEVSNKDASVFALIASYNFTISI